MEEIASFSVAEWGAARTSKYRKALDTAFDRIVRLPGSGAAMNELPEVHSVLSGRHRIYYSFDDEVVRVRRILHTNMEAPRRLG